MCKNFFLEFLDLEFIINLLTTSIAFCCTPPITFFLFLYVSIVSSSTVKNNVLFLFSVGLARILNFVLVGEKLILYLNSYFNWGFIVIGHFIKIHEIVFTLTAGLTLALIKLLYEFKLLCQQITRFRHV